VVERKAVPEGLGFFPCFDKKKKKREEEKHTRNRKGECGTVTEIVIAKRKSVRGKWRGKEMGAC